MPKSALILIQSFQSVTLSGQFKLLDMGYRSPAANDRWVQHATTRAWDRDSSRATQEH